MEITGKGAGTAPQGQCLAGSPGFLQSLPGEQKNISDFCKNCEPWECGLIYPPAVRAGIFQDRMGIIWICRKKGDCEHAIIAEGRMQSCVVRTRQLRDQERGRA